MDITQISQLSLYREGEIKIINGMPDIEKYISFNSNMTILLMCKQGRIQVCINDKPTTMERCDLLFMLPNSKIGEIMFSSDVDCSAICIESLKVQNFLRTQDLLNLVLAIRSYPLLHIEDEQFRALIDLKECVVQMFSTDHPYYERIMSHFIEIILYDIFGNYKKAIDECVQLDDNATNRPNQLFSKFIRLLSIDRGINRSVKFYADKLYITPKYLSHICKQVSGKTSSQWITDIVTDEIKHYLCYTDLSIKEIAGKLLFANQSFFTKFTKQQLGCTPIEYRQRYSVDKS